MQPIVVSATKRQLIECIQGNIAPLLGTIRTYVQRMDLASGEYVHGVALEVMQEVVIEALGHADRFDASRQPMAWLLGIAINMIRRKKVEEAKRDRRELSLSRLSMLHPESEGEMLAQLISPAEKGPEYLVESDEHVEAILSLVSAQDQQVLRLALLEEFEREALARQLGTTYGAARMRLHRALGRLRLAWSERQQKLQGGEGDE